MTICVRCCGSARTPSWSKDGWSYARCAGCGLVSLDPLPAAGDSRELYSEGYFQQGAAGGYVDYAGDEALHRRNARARLSLLSSPPPGLRHSRAGGNPEPYPSEQPTVPPPPFRHSPEGRESGRPSVGGRLLDVGCAVGFFLDEARSAGWSVEGVEVSPWAAAEARRRTGAPIHDSLAAAAAAAAEPFDAVTIFQVLEHLPRPDEALAQAAAVLRPGGRLAIETWDRDSLVARLFGSHWQQITPPSVIHLFSRRDVGALLERVGFEVYSAKRTAKRVSAGFVAGLLAGKYPRAGGALRRAVEAVGLGRLSVSYQLGDLITVIGRKRDPRG